MVDTCHYIFLQTHRTHNTKRDPNVNCGLWVVMMSQCWFISCNKHASLLGVVACGGDCARVGAGSIWSISVPSSQLYCEPKTDLKILLNASNCKY